MRSRRRAGRAFLPLAAMLMGPAMPAVAAAQAAPARADASSNGPDWMLLGVAAVTFIVGRTLVMRRYKRGGKTPR